MLLVTWLELEIRLVDVIVGGCRKYQIHERRAGFCVALESLLYLHSSLSELCGPTARQY
jgi:hypothetical protein